jgi:hypothetical protein
MDPTLLPAGLPSFERKPETEKLEPREATESPTATTESIRRFGPRDPSNECLLTSNQTPLHPTLQVGQVEPDPLVS